MDDASARTILSWRYEPPYDFYNLHSDDAGEAVRTMMDPQNAYHTLVNQQGDLVAYCCFGADAQVCGGDYAVPALDIGLGVRPDLTGQGAGPAFVGAVLEFAQRTFTVTMFRVTVAKFNERALRVWERAGFRATQTFHRLPDGRPFVGLTCRAPRNMPTSQGGNP
jgi:ribosomal-protein-alanine N-acetyltransferase